MNIKPILFDTNMVRAILDGRKTCTRIVVKPPPKKENGMWILGDTAWPPDVKCLYSNLVRALYWSEPYHAGDILWVQEPWRRTGCAAFDRRGMINCECVQFAYQADMDGAPEAPWEKPERMPRKAARLFLRVTDVRLEQLQGIPERGPRSAEREGFSNDINLQDGTGASATKHFSVCWDSTIRAAELDKYGWNANPWVWVYSFERCGKPEGWPEQTL